MKYKLIHLKFQLKTPLQFGYVLQKWLERLDECENMTLGTHALPTATDYYAYMNDGKLSAYIRPGDSIACKFGTVNTNTTSYLHTGFSMQLSPWRSGITYFDYIEVKARIIVDEDNNLVFASALTFPSNPIWDGFMFTNEGIMSIAGNDIYSIGGVPAQIASCGLTQADYMSGIGAAHQNDGDLEIFRSKGLILLSGLDEIAIRDHIEVMYSFQQAAVSNSYAYDMFEQITVDGQKYLHLSRYTWIPFEEESEEVIEVRAA